MNDETVILDAHAANTESFVRLEDSLSTTPTESSEGEPSTSESIDLPGMTHPPEATVDSRAITEIQSERVSSHTGK